MSNNATPAEQPSQVASESIDTPEFSRLLGNLIEHVLDRELYAPYENVRRSLIAHIDAWGARRTGDAATEAERKGWSDGMQEAQELLAEEIRDAARYSYIEDHATTSGGGHGFTISCFIPFDEEDMGVGIDRAIAATPSPHNNQQEDACGS